MKKYKHIIITGPSFVGKSLVAGLILDQERTFMKCVTATTRKPRTGEENGKDYFFFTRERFLQLKSDGFFLETNEFIKKGDGVITLYGTPKSFFDEHANDSILAVVDPNGAHAIKSYLGDECITVFITPETEQVLVERINKRRTNETDDEIEERLNLARKQMEGKDSFDYCLVNEDGLDKASALARKIISLATIVS